jgi:hypothetical protein
LTYTPTARGGTKLNRNYILGGGGGNEDLRTMVYAPWYVPNAVFRRDLQIATVKEEIQRYSARLSALPNDLIANLMELPDIQAIAKTPAKWTAYQILSVIVVFVILFSKV